MRRRIAGLHTPDSADVRALQGTFLAEIERAFFTPNPQKPFFTIRFRILEPADFTGKTFAGRIYASERALWKLSWFLRDFGYDSELFARDEIDDKALIGLRGVVRVSTNRINGRSFSSLEAFASATAWDGTAAEPLETSA